MMSKSKLSNLLKGKSVPNLPSYSSPWNKNDEKLWNAIKQQNVKNVKSVLSKTSVSPTKLGPQGKSVFHLACEVGNEQIIDAILASTQDVNDTTIQGVTALHRAAAKGHTNTVNKLLKKQANVDQRDCDGMTALHHACFGQHQECVKVLLLKNADLNAVEQGGKTPLFYSAHLGNLEICRWLLDKGADINCQDKDNITPLILAAKEGHTNVCELLLRRGANPELTDRYGKTAVDYAAASKHLELQDVFSRAIKRAFEGSDKRSVSLSDSGSHQFDDPETDHSSPAFNTPLRNRGGTFVTDDANVSRADVHSIHSMDDSLLPNRQHSPTFHRSSVPSRIEEAYRVDETVPKSVYLKELRNLQEQVEQQKKIMEAYKSREQTLMKQIVTDGDNPIIDNTQKKEILQQPLESGRDVLDLKKYKLTVGSEKEQLKYAASTAQIKGTGDQEELLFQNEALMKEVESLRHAVVSLQEELQVTKNEEPTDAQRLDAILAASRNFEEEVNFDEEGFVEGRDMTKEEFLQGQNQQLKAQCGQLTEELEKLRVTFDAILKAGDNLQADYDHLATEKDALQDELEVALKEKRDYIAENEFLLSDNNELHENLKKIVHELEKMQETYQTVHLENEELKRSVTVASKVGEVARLLEERGLLQQRCADLESISQRLQHDHDILLEEVQSLNESVNQLTGQRNQLVADLEEMETICQQHETLQVEYNQLEMEFAELLRDKEALEQQISNNNEVKVENDAVKAPDVTSLEKTLKQLTAEKQQVESDKQDLENVVKGLTKHIVATENKVRDLENNLEQLRAVSVLHKLDKNGVDHEDNNKGDEIKKYQEEIMNLKLQIIQLTQEVEEWEKKHADTVSTYRTHLLSAVQGHMDPDVKDALYHIIELRSMEQFC